jgi:uncharacterized protein GlcG (DUF336 family)
MARKSIMPLLVGMLAAGGAAPALADGLIAAHKIPAALANEAVAETVAACAKQNYAETAVVVDVDGVRIALLRGDGAGAHTLDSAYYKAYTAASFKADSTAVVERAKANPTLQKLLEKLPYTVEAGGGLVIKLDNEVLGAIGAAGAPGFDLDDACAKAGLDKIRDRLK